VQRFVAQPKAGLGGDCQDDGGGDPDSHVWCATKHKGGAGGGGEGGGRTTCACDSWRGKRREVRGDGDLSGAGFIARYSQHPLPTTPSHSLRARFPTPSSDVSAMESGGLRGGCMQILLREGLGTDEWFWPAPLPVSLTLSACPSDSAHPLRPLRSVWLDGSSLAHARSQMTCCSAHHQMAAQGARLVPRCCHSARRCCAASAEAHTASIVVRPCPVLTSHLELRPAPSRGSTGLAGVFTRPAGVAPPVGRHQLHPQGSSTYLLTPCTVRALPRASSSLW